MTRLFEGEEQTIILQVFDYAYHGKGHSIHSKGQMEHIGHQVEDRSRRSGGSQWIVMNDGGLLPLSVRDGLSYLDTEPITAEDMGKYPIVNDTTENGCQTVMIDNEFSIADLKKAAPVQPAPNSIWNGNVNACGQILDSLTTNLQAVTSAVASIVTPTVDP